MHVLQIIANNATVPYFSWFADGIGRYPDVKFSFVAMCSEKPVMIEEMKQKGCDCYWIKFDSKQRKKSMITSFFALYKLFRRLKPDVVNTHLFDDSLPALFAARLAGVKKRMIYKQDTAFHWYYKPKWVWADKFNNANATHIIAVSDESKKFIIEKEKADGSKVYRIHSGISIAECTKQDEAFKKQFREKYDLEGKIVIGAVARFIEWKGYRYIVEAARILAPKYNNLRFIFVGQGEQKKEIEGLIKQYNLQEHIIITGYIEKKYMGSIFGLMDMFVHAAVMEPFGFVIAEAMANGVPLVTTKTASAADSLVHEQTCYFTEYKNPQSIAEGIQWMLEHPDKREEMKEKIKKIAGEKFKAERMLDDFIKLYKGELRP